MTHDPPVRDPIAECNHASMQPDDTEWRCPCGLVIDRQPTREGYLAAARANLKERKP